ncbi:hypothetical protein V8C86DRAFT_1384050 [Haematococcus lacustris]
MPVQFTRLWVKQHPSPPASYPDITSLARCPRLLPQHHATVSTPLNLHHRSHPHPHPWLWPPHQQRQHGYQHHIPFQRQLSALCLSKPRLLWAPPAQQPAHAPSPLPQLAQLFAHPHLEPRQSSLPRGRWCGGREGLRVWAVGAGAGGRGRRVGLVKRRPQLPARQRRRDKYQDEPYTLQVPPTSPAFPGRMASEINAANGPRQLLCLVQQGGQHLTALHLGDVLARLAGWATGRGLRPDQEQALLQAGALCQQLLRRRLDEAEPLTLARAAYSLHRLQLHDRELLGGVVLASGPQLSSFRPDALAGLVAALGGAGQQRVTVPQAWLERCCLAAYVRLPRYGAQDLANLAFGLARLEHTPSAVWQAAVMKRFREAVGVAGATPPCFVKLAWALAKFQAQPSFNWLLAFCGELRSRIDLYTARELASLVWSLARLHHSPDPVFQEAWFRAATRRITNFMPTTLLLALRSLAELRLSDLPPPGKFIVTMLDRSQGLLRSLNADECSALLWSLVALRVKPNERWMDALMRRLEGCEALPQPPALSDLALALARLRYQPSEEWAALVEAQTGSELAGYEVEQLAVLCWAWGNVELEVPAAWQAVLADKGLAVEGDVRRLMERSVVARVASLS